MSATAGAPPIHDADEERLNELGYKQELNRSWSGFQNFAISFTIISILAGCFTTYGQAWNNGGPIAISIGWPIISLFILVIALCMSELVSAYPTAGGIYWWAARLGGPVWGWFTGWFNLIGLIAVTASVDYGAAIFLNTLLGVYKVDWFNGMQAGNAFFHGTFFLFLVILTFHVIVNIAGSHLVARVNGISVWWHVVGVAVILAVLIFVPAHHASAKFVFTQKFNNSGLFNGSLSNVGFWFYVLPLGFLLTQYTITGYDSCAHISEETKGASTSAAKGVWRSVFYSAIFGWILLLAITFCVQNVSAVNKAAAGGAYISLAIIQQAVNSGWFKLVLLISTVGQLFCGAACLTSASRMCYAFSRDGAIPGWRIWSKVNARRVPAAAVVFMAVIGAIITIPAYFPASNGVPVAFYAVVSISVIGLYIAYVIPIYLRWRKGREFETGPWSLGNKYRWMNPIAVAEVAIVTVVFCLPTLQAGVPGDANFDWKSVNYAPLVTGFALIAVTLWWLLSARRTFTGPRHTVAEIDAELGEIPAGGGPGVHGAI